MTMWGLGYNAVEAGDYATAEPILIEVVDRLGRLGNETMVAWATRTLAFCYEELGNHVRSRVLHEQNLVLIRRLGDHVLESATLSALSTFALEDGRLRDSASLMREGLQLTGQIRDRMMTITRLGAAANTLASLGKESTAAVLLGCADAQFEEVGAVEPWAVRFNERTLTLVRAKLEEDALAEMRAKGRELTLEAAVAMGILALDEALESL
jgi:hypothetical protein